MIMLEQRLDGAWLGVDNNFNFQDPKCLVEKHDVMHPSYISGLIRKAFLDVQVWFLDLDDYDADSPAKMIARNAIGTSHLSPRWQLWSAITAMALVSDFFSASKKDCETARWKKYVNAFLDGQHARTELKRIFSDSYVRSTLYPGVEEFYQLLPGRKLCLSRNVAEVVAAYARVLGFKNFYPRADDKASIVKEIIERNTSIRKYGVSGDSREDLEVLKLLKSYYHEGRIDRPVSLQVADSPGEKDIIPGFDVYVGKDRRILVNLLR